MPDPDNRRPLKSRGSAWAKGLASAMARAQINPNVISGLSTIFAVLGGALFLWGGTSEGVLRAAAFALAAVCIQLRLVCNLLDGMVAVEHGQGSSSGPIYNELPDRFSDVLFLACAGYAAERAGIEGGAVAGWIAASAAVTTAYVRELGRGMGFAADFSGPLAKPQRMAVLTLAALASIFEPLWGGRGQVLMVGLVVIALGTLLTIGRRTVRLARNLEERAHG